MAAVVSTDEAEALRDGVGSDFVSRVETAVVVTVFGSAERAVDIPIGTVSRPSVDSRPFLGLLTILGSGGGPSAGSQLRRSAAGG